MSDLCINWPCRKMRGHVGPCTTLDEWADGEIPDAVVEKQLIEELGAAEAALSAMTADRDLWASDHEEDCPNLTLLELAREELSKAQQERDAAYREVDRLGNILRSEHRIANKSGWDALQQQVTQLEADLRSCNELPGPYTP